MMAERERRAENRIPDVRLGQVWQDWDCRYRDGTLSSKGRRLIKILRAPGASEIEAAPNPAVLGVQVLTWYEKTEAIKRRQTIRLGRFVPNSSGYKLATDVPKTRENCCGIIYEHGGLTSSRPCPDCPLAAI